MAASLAFHVSLVQPAVHYKRLAPSSTCIAVREDLISKLHLGVASYWLSGHDPRAVCRQLVDSAARKETGVMGRPWLNPAYTLAASVSAKLNIWTLLLMAFGSRSPGFEYISSRSVMLV